LNSIAVIQARTTSSRLPAKVLLPVAGYPLVVLAAKRAANTGRDVIVAISDESTDDYLAEVLAASEIRFFRGSLKNVLSRFVVALESFEDEKIVVRLTGDNVLPDGHLIDEVEKHFIENKLEYLICNGADSGLPYGLSLEMTRLKHLRSASRESSVAFDIEHVTPAIRRKFGSHYFKKYLSKKMGNYRVTVDCLNDYLQIVDLFGSVKNPVEEDSIYLIEKLRHKVQKPISDYPEKKIVFGAVQLGMQYGVANSTGKPDFDLSKKMLETAIDNGVGVIDTASAYGDSEWIIGKSLDQGLKSRVSIITKLDPLENLPSQAGPSVCDAFVDASVYGSLTKLGIERIDTLLLHRGSHLTQFDGAIFDRLLFHLKAGRIGSLGVSVQSPEELIEAIDHQEVEHIQMPFNLLDWRWDNAIEQIRKTRASRRLIIHLRSVYLQGLLLLRDEKAWQSANRAHSDVIFHWLDDSIQRFERGSVQDLCIAFVKGLDWVDGIVIGMETYDQLVENLVIFSKDPLTAPQRDELIAKRPYVQESTLNPSLWAKN
jgi:spore coat polysaccharide biosynthesis protein SpsF (cytidylyltransferase family)/aryl-alcohol dehydrogenase-like predicted oxidoreductase